MKRLFVLLLAAAVVLAAFVVVQPLREAGRDAVGAGRDLVAAAGGFAEAAGGVVDAAGDAVGAAGDALESGRDTVGQAADTVQAARQLNDACDLVRAAVAPGTPPEESAAKLQEAVTIVDGVVAAYPDLPGMSELESGLALSKQALAADPTGETLGVTRGQVDEACSRIPPLP